MQNLTTIQRLLNLTVWLAFALAVMLVPAFVTPARAAEDPDALIVDLRYSDLVWTFLQTAGDPIEGFRIGCAENNETSVKPKIIEDPDTRRVAIQDVVPKAGHYVCTIVAVNSFGDSGPSPPWNFKTGSVPVGTWTVTIEVRSPEETQ